MRLLYSNCLLFAMSMARRRKAAGVECYILRRRGRMGPLPHWLYAERRPSGSLRIVSYVPVVPEYLPWMPLFRGRVKWGDRRQ